MGIMSASWVDPKPFSSVFSKDYVGQEGFRPIVLDGYIENKRGDGQLEIKGDNLLSLYESYVMQDIYI